MVLSFALCATFAFAQTNRVVGQAKINDNRQMVSQNVKTATLNGAAVNYKGSIFAKDDTLALFDFSMAPTDANANYSFGVIGANERIGDVTEPQHAQTHQGATFHRWVGVDSATLLSPSGQNMNAVYPESGYVWGNPHYTNSAGYRLDTDYCSSLNGWVMLDAWDTERGSGNINAYVAFAAVPTTDVTLFSVRLFEFFMHFYDKTYVDYSTDGGTTWKTVQIHTNVAVNDEFWGFNRFAMPSAAAAGESVLLRIRFKSTHNTGYGYLWYFDDVAVTKNVENQFTRNDEYWLTGAYHQMPKGMELPIEWGSQIVNTGINDQPNTQVKIDNIYAGNVTPIHTWNLGLVPTEQDSTYDLSTTACMPTSNVGDNFVTVTLSSDNITAAPYDTILYMVNDINEGSYTWGRDNGLLNAEHSFLWGYDTSTFQNEDNETQHYVTENSPYYTNAGTSVYVLYETGNTIPVDANQQPWVIRGIEYVVGVDEEIVSNLPAIITPEILRDSATGDGYIQFLTVPTGISSYTTTPGTEYNDPTEMRDFGGHYAINDGYNTVRIEFPTQTELMPNQQYHVGYSLVEDGKFAVARTAPNYYTQWDEENQRYTYQLLSRNNQLAKYANNFTYGDSRLAKGDDVLYYNNVEGFAWAGYSVSYFPMIRLLVGPRSATKGIRVTCAFEDDDDDLGGVYTADLRGACGDTIQIVEGASTRVYIIPEQDFTVFTLSVDGTEIDVTTLPHETITTSSAQYTGYYYEFENVTADHEVVASFAVGIDDVAARVKMNLQPNPASSNVKLNIAGVTGYVNCSLIDMSGRVVRTDRINAETENTINLNGLAKGAYFVRITNNDFTKVERLIVR